MKKVIKEEKKAALPPLKAPYKKNVQSKFFNIHKTEEEIEKDEDLAEEDNPEFDR